MLPRPRRIRIDERPSIFRIPAISCRLNMPPDNPASLRISPEATARIGVLPRRKIGHVLDIIDETLAVH